MTSSECLVRFPTALGTYEVEWSATGITRLTLLDGDVQPRTLPVGLPGFVDDLIADVQAHLAGDLRTFDRTPVDLSALPRFRRAVLEETRGIRAGEIRTYGDVAKALGKPGAARAVGQALGHNPVMVVVPCHRVIAAGGRPGGFSAPGGFACKLELLALEGVNL